LTVAAPTPAPRIVALHLAGDPDPWRRLGFAVADDVCRLGDLELRFESRGDGRGLAGWTLAGVRSHELDGLPTTLTKEVGPTARAAAAHPNGALALDHVVVFTPGFERTLAAFHAAGLEPRRVATIGVKYEAVRRAFYKLGAVVVEVVDQRGHDVDQTGPAFFWGIAVTVGDLDGLARELGESTSGARDAVQPGRRIAPVRRAAGLGLPVAFMSPEPGRASSPPAPGGRA
jgi:hypothetical protein